MDEREIIVRGVLWVFGADGGIKPGEFAENLIRAFGHANKREFVSLAMGFPMYANIVTAYRNGTLDKKYFKKMEKEREL